MHPKSFTSRHTSHGIKYESDTIHAYVKQMSSISMAVEVFRSGLIVYKKEPVLSCSPDGKVTGCPTPFVTLHGKTGIKVIARSQHANTACLVCPKTRLMRIFNL